ncbi:MAG: PD40 domain-containing protein [Gammaproteobacteria bacterium]|nr:PD40 domain-containing protein [Gammaproteobacteria bacterium]
MNRRARSWLQGCLAAGVLLLMPAVHAGTLVEFTQGTQLALDLSPDGRELAMDLQGIAWTLPVSGGAATPRTDPLWQARQPRYTRDGQSLVFTALHPDAWNLWQLPLDGGPARQLTQGPYADRDPVVHPDGEHIVFVSDRSGADDLWRLRLADGRLEQLSFHASRESQPAVSPDGQRIAYISRDSDGYHLRLRSVTGAQATLLSSTDALSAPSWRADGSLLLVVRERPGRAEMMMLLVGQETVLKPASWGEMVAPTAAVWPDRERFVYSADGLIKRRSLGSRRAEVVPFFAVTSLPDRTHQPPPTRFELDQRMPVRGLRGPSVSPDGRKLALSAQGALWLIGRDGSGQTLVETPAQALDPAWSPDGRRLAFAAADPDGDMALYSVEVDGGDLRRLAKTQGDIHLPAWSPDGGRIALLVARDVARRHTDLAVLDLADGTLTIVAAGLDAPGRPAWVHGQRVVLAAAAAAPGAPGELLAIDLPSRQRTPVSGVPPGGLGPRGHDGPVASPDGRRLALVRDSRLWLAELDSYGESVRSLRELTEQVASAPSWAADNRTLVFQSGAKLKWLDADSGATGEWPLALDLRPYSGDALWVLQAGRIYDPAASAYVADQDIFIEGQRIVEVVPRGSRALPSRVVDATRDTVLPGLIDLDARGSGLQGPRLGAQWLAHGVTTLREPITDPYDALARHEAWAGGRVPGPRLLFGGPVLDGARSAGAASVPIRSDEQLALEIARAAALGQHVLHVGALLPGHQRLRAVSLAAEAGIRVTTDDVATAAFIGAAGVAGLQGARGRRDGNSTSMAYSDLGALAARAGIALTPLLGTDARAAASAHAGLAAIASGGGLIGAGSGASPLPPGVSLHAEVVALADSPLGTAGALRAVTLDAAWVLGAAGSLGSVSAGKLADLVIVRGDPLADIRALEQVRAVISGGRYFPVDVLRMPPLANDDPPQPPDGEAGPTPP